MSMASTVKPFSIPVSLQLCNSCKRSNLRLAPTLNSISRASRSIRSSDAILLRNSSKHGIKKSLLKCAFSRSFFSPGLESLRNKLRPTHVRGSPPRRHLVVNSIFERFTERAITSVILAQGEAKSMGRGEVEAIHLFLGLVAKEVNSDGFFQTGIEVEIVRDTIRKLVAEGLLPQSLPVSTSTDQLPFAASSKRIFELALIESNKMKHKFISPEHLMIALLVEEAGPVSIILERLSIRKDKLLGEAHNRLEGELESEGTFNPPPQKSSARSSIGGSRKPTKKGDKSPLDDFCVDLTALAMDGEIDPLVGREKEVERAIEILARRTKNNPILLGDPGVGKTAIAEGLAIRIAANNVPDFLLGKKLLSLNLSSLLAGTKERGELESRVTGLVRQVTESGNIILFIDEVHNIVGMGSVGRNNNSSGLDIANIFKPALARGHFQCIGATTYNEHRKYIEKDKALARRFQPISVLEPSIDVAVQILMGLKDKYEKHHQCHFTDEAIAASVELSSKYIPDRYLPDKAIDLMDEAGSKARINAFFNHKARLTSILHKPPSEYWREIREVHDKPNSSLSFNGNTETAENYSISQLTHSVSPLPPDSEADDGPIIVGPEEIAVVASLMTGVPIQKLSEDDQKKLLELESILKLCIIGQDDAIGAVSRAVRRARVGLKGPNRPIATMLFCGPVGVGKTQLTKALAEHYFGSPSSMIRLDMSEFMERHSVSKLIGSPPGYIGYDEGGKLTEAVRRKPYCVVLLDEIEKAHPDVFNLLLQIFEDGRLTDSQGRTVSFKNCLLVMTSNVASTIITKGGRNQIGFTLTDNTEKGNYLAMKATVMDELKNFFRPELLNRLDEVIVFGALQKHQVRSIVNIMLMEIKERMLKQKINLEVSEAILAKVCEEGYDKDLGARPLRRALAARVEDVVSDALLREDIKNGDTALVDLGFDGIPFVTSLPTPDPCEYNICLSNLKIPVRVTGPEAYEF